MIDYEGHTIEGKYLIRKLLGEGGMGRVYLGEHVLIGRSVAVKFLHSELTSNEEIVRRFYREAQSAAAIRHKNVIDVFDVGVSPEGEPFLVMEYLEGESLSDLIARVGTFDVPTACGILEPALLALQAAHDRGIVHRDLKPENIFLAHEAGEPPTVKLIDFGISKVNEATGQTKLTRDGSLLGTPEYMSPEQARGAADLDHRTDLYAMGVILYEMLAGDRPFVGANYNELLLSVLTEAPRPPRDVNPDFPEEATALVMRALARDPAERFQSAAEMLEAMRGLPGFARRGELLTQLAPGLGKTGVASGDLGRPLVRGRTGVAEDVLERVIRERRQLLGTPKRRLVAAVLGLLVLIIVSLLIFGGGEGEGNKVVKEDTVTITVRGAAADAKIFWDGYLVPHNPFKVGRGEALVPMRVESRGRKAFKVSIAPSADQIVDLAAKETVAPRPAEASENAATTEATEKQAPADEGPPQPKKGKRESKVKRFFRNLTNG
jgi:tRNA A-37 threonylcarbamoyl transferase component Bud32